MTTSVAKSILDSLTEELLMEILQRLPLKVVIRCKSVSKIWFEFISSNYFARSYISFRDTERSQFAIIHRYRGIIRPCVFPETSSSSFKLTLTRTIPEGIIPPPWDPSSFEFQFLAASNGWVLCSYPDRSGEVYYVVNPLTKHRITLPPIPRTSDQFCRVGFVFIDRFCARSSNSFRAVRFPPVDEIPANATTMKLDIFSSETGQWTQSTLSFLSRPTSKRSAAYDCPLNYHAIDLNGKLHWLHVWFDKEIFVYDPYDPEKYQRLSLPKDCLGMSRYCFGTCNCEGRRRKHLKYLESNQGVVRVWELKDYDKVEWDLLHKVSLSELTSCVTGTPHVDWPPASYSGYNCPDVVALHPWDGDFVVCQHRTTLRFLQYNMRSKTVEIFLEQGQEVRPDRELIRTYFLFELPCWPTRVPSSLWMDGFTQCYDGQHK